MIEKLEAVERGDIKRLMIFLPPGAAKALALDTPIPTPTGWSRMGDINVGDMVFDEYGKPCNVTWVSPIHRNRPVYRVTTDCGDTITADQDHEWLVRLCGKPRKPPKKLSRGMANRDDPMSQFKIKKTSELFRRRAKRPMIKRAGALQLPAASLPIDPYLLGVWLGDGTSASPAITSSLDDLPWMRGEIERLGYKTSARSVPTLFGVLGVRAEFVRLGLINDPHHHVHGRKHIPAAYMRGNIEQRMALLQGLIDTDGTVCKRRGGTTFCNTSRELAEQTRDLVRSLGVKAGWSESRAMLYGKDCGPVYRVSFYLHGSARMPRKAVLCRDQIRTPNTYIDVTESGIADTVCIEVDSPSHLFLCGRSMTPTHNSTYSSQLFPSWYMGRHPDHDLVAASHTAELAEKFGRRVRNIVNTAEHTNLFPDARLSDDSQAAHRWATKQGGQYFAVGVGGAITGQRANGGIIDDPVKGREDADSESQRQKMREWYTSEFLTRLKPDAWIVICMTRWHEADLAGWLLEESERGGATWDVLSLPAEAEAGDPLGRKIGDRLWPEWYTDEMLAMAKRDPRSWSALYQQRPAPDEGGYYQRTWFNWYKDAPKHLIKVGASDYAVTDGGGDGTEHGIFGIDAHEDIYVIDWWSGRTTPDEWIETQIDLILAQKPSLWIGESGVIRRAIESPLKKRMLQRRAWCRTEWIASISDKPTRSRSFQALCAAGKVYLPVQAPWLDQFLHQHLTFPAGKFDDMVDVTGLIGRVIDKTRAAIIPKTGNAHAKPAYGTFDWLLAGDKKQKSPYRMK